MKNRLFDLTPALSIILTGILWTSCTDKSQHQQTAQEAFDAWAQGEASGNYNEFKKFIDSSFTQYSHPLSGSFGSKEANKKMADLIAERERKPNHLKFSDVTVLSNKEQVGFSFQSEGVVSGGFPYKGSNLIVFTIRNGKITGFSEYFGRIDSTWFRQ